MSSFAPLFLDLEVGCGWVFRCGAACVCWTGGRGGARGGDEARGHRTTSRRGYDQTKASLPSAKTPRHGFGGLNLLRELSAASLSRVLTFECLQLPVVTWQIRRGRLLLRRALEEALPGSGAEHLMLPTLLQ